jgi:gliding motility-associated-like protein
MNSNLDSLTSVSPATTTEYEHLFSRGTPLAGCYSITAVDSFENESVFSARTCIDNCSQYSLPNVFTPNDDNYNDIYLSNNPNHFVEKVDMKIFNRYGQLVYETNDPDIKWDGKYRNTKDRLATGVYYYVCDVYEPRISGIEIRTLDGFIHLYAEGDGKKITF